MIHIEYMGIPGAGKSTLKDGSTTMYRQHYPDEKYILHEQEALAHVLKENMPEYPWSWLCRILPVSLLQRISISIFSKSWYRFTAQNRFLISHWQALEAFFNSPSCATMPREEKILVLSWFFEMASLYQALYDAATLPIFFDEGFMQRTMNLFMTPGLQDNVILNRSFLLQYLNNIPLPDIVIFIRVDPSIGNKRIHERSLPYRLRNMNVRDTLHYLEDCSSHFHFLARWLQDKKVSVITVNNSQPIKESCEKLAQLLFQKMGGKKHVYPEKNRRNIIQ